ncbi:MAG: histidine kinase [Azoarcus sp.]|jgi:signal transduction histidine kinase|nr:histidine kinase [Azoarcus sp.]
MDGHFHPFAACRGTVLFAFVWTVLVLVSLFLQREQLNHTAAELARIAAIASLRKDMAIREWASSVGGVFVRNDRLPAFNSLEQEQHFSANDRSGEALDLVLLTPMHMLLAIQGLSNRQFEFKERLTSRQLRNRENMPDDWEIKALEELGKGASIITEPLSQDGRGHGLMRVMLPMKMEKECMECHRDTLVPVGGLRGGASISVDLNAYRTAQEPTWRAIQFWHGTVWLLGLATIALLHVITRRRAQELRRSGDALRESQARLRELARFLQGVRESERTSIARELHDELGQALTALRIDLGWLRKNFDRSGNAGGGKTCAGRIDGSRALVERTIESMRRISEGLRPGMLDVLGLRAALEHLVRQFGERCGIGCVFYADRDEYKLDSDRSIAVFRLVQEALTNISRHARATHVDIRMEEIDGRLHLLIQDDGVGFDLHVPRRGFGLLGMSERVSMLGGEMSVDGSHGVRISVILPLSEDSSEGGNP